MRLPVLKRLVTVCLVAVALAGCDEGQEKSLAQCELNALPTYKDGWQTWGPESVGYRRYIDACMKVAGFEHNNRPNRCTVGFFMEHNPYCYSPTANNDFYLIWRIRIYFDGGLIGNYY
jgi:hypothetical protein